MHFHWTGNISMVPLTKPWNVMEYFYLVCLLCLCLFWCNAAGLAEDGGSHTEIPNSEWSGICFTEQVPDPWTRSCATCIWSSRWTFFTACRTLPGVSSLMFWLQISSHLGPTSVCSEPSLCQCEWAVEFNIPLDSQLVRSKLWCCCKCFRLFYFDNKNSLFLSDFYLIHNFAVSYKFDV